ncbi:hypothetical protein Tco_1151895 [Tanacetum coccineum]
MQGLLRNLVGYAVILRGKGQRLLRLVTVEEMTMNFGKLDKFKGHDLRRWQKKRHFMLTTLKVVYVLTTLMPELMEDDMVESIRRRAKLENEDYI